MADAPQPSSPVQEAARRGLDSAWRRQLLWAALLCLLAVVTIPLGILLTAEYPSTGRSQDALAIIGFVPLLWGALLTFGAWRTASGRQVVREGPYVAVDVVGWSRNGDGSNLGLFNPGDDPLAAEPFAVVRLPLRKKPVTTSGWLCGPTVSNTQGPVAVVDDQGALLGAGLFVGIDKGLRNWARRDPPTRVTRRPTPSARDEG